MQNSKPKPGLAIATLVTVFATLLVNTLSNIFPPAGQNIGEIANTVLAGVLITPANYAFAIWGAIYVGSIAYGVYQLQPTQQRNPTFWRANRLLIAACLAQIVWIFCFTLQQFALSVVAMLGILLPLSAIYFDISTPSRLSWRQLWCAQIPFSVYTAWISVATLTNVASALYVANWSGWGLGDVTWTAIALVGGGVLAGAVAVVWRDSTFVLVYVWAYLAIAIRHADTPTIWTTAIAVVVVLLGLLAFSKRATGGKFRSGSRPRL